MKERDVAGTEIPVEDLLPGRRSGSALGRDPFAEEAVIDPFLERLEQGWVVRSTRPPVRPPRSQDSGPAPAGEPGVPPVRLRRARRSATPQISEVELERAQDWVDRVLGEDERRRLTALFHLVEGETPFDRFGFSPRAARLAFPFFYAIYKLYFRVRSHGHEHLPTEGPVVLAANHGGLLPFDGAMGVLDVMLHTDPPRLPRAIVDRWAGALPWINVFYARVGQVVGTRENFSDLLDDDQMVLVFPEGIEGIRKTVTQRYRLQRFRVGFVEQALRSRAPIVPMAFLGSDDQTPILYDVKPLARQLGLPVAPITPTFPLLGPLGLLPYPVRYRIVYGEPLCFHERFGPEGAHDARLVRYLANQVRRAVQVLVDRNRT